MDLAGLRTISLWSEGYKLKYVCIVLDIRFVVQVNVNETKFYLKNLEASEIYNRMELFLFQSSSFNNII